MCSPVECFLEDELSPFFYFVQTGQHNDVLLCIKQGIDIYSAINQSSKSTVLHIAAKYGFNDIIDTLIAAKSSLTVKSKDQDGQLPLHYAAKAGFLNTCKKLIVDYDSPVTNADYSMQLPMHCAIESRDLPTFKYLLHETDKARRL